MQRAPRLVVPGLLGVTLGAVSGCGTSPIQVLSATSSGMDAGIDATVDAQVAVDAPAKPPPEDAPIVMTQDFCDTTGAPVLNATTDAGLLVQTCPDQLAQNAFRYALCVCENYTTTNALTTDAFDGTKGPYSASAATPGGSVGVNGYFHPTGLLTIRGSLWASDMDPIFTTSILHVDGDVHIAHAELEPTTLVVQGDAWLGGGIQTTGNVTIGHTMHVPSGAPTNVMGTLQVGGMDATPFPYSPACNCDRSQFVDVAGVVRTYETQNDDVALGIEKTSLANVTSDYSNTLPCGRAFLTSIGGTGSIHLTVTKRLALFVAGDLSTTGNFVIDAPPGTELDLFVGGNVTVGGMFVVGDPNNPARARTYVGGSVNLSNAATLAGNLYAPNAQVTLGNTAATTLYGALFAKSLNANSDLTIHYDEAILTPSLAPTCPLPTSCSSCNDCNGQPCLSGTCGTCAVSSQCCAPLVCDTQSGQCVASVVLK